LEQRQLLLIKTRFIFCSNVLRCVSPFFSQFFCKNKAMPSYSHEDLAVIKTLRVEKGWGARRMMKEFPGKTNWTRSGLEGIIRKVDETGSATRKEGSGRPRTQRTDENTEEVEMRVLSQEDQPGTHLSQREIARDWNSSKHRAEDNKKRTKAASFQEICNSEFE
jgi:hypothetical protein